MADRRVRRTGTAVGLTLVAVTLAVFLADRGGVGRIRSLEVRQTAPCRVAPDGRTVSAPFVADGSVRGGSRRVGARLTVYRGHDLGNPVAWQTRKVRVSGRFDTSFTVSVDLPGLVSDAPVCVYRVAT